MGALRPVSTAAEGSGRRLAALALMLGFALTPSMAGADAREGTVWRAEEWTDLGGRTWTSADLEGRVVLLDFWATWCPPCLAEIPELRKLHERYGERGLVLVGVALDTLERRRLRAFLLRHGMEWPQVHAPEGTDSELARRFAVEAVPATILVDRAGRVVARDLPGPALDAVVSTLLALPEPPEESTPKSPSKDEKSSYIADRTLD